MKEGCFRVHCSSGSNNVRNVGHSGAGAGAEVENFRSRFNPHVVNTTENGGGKLGPEDAGY